MAPSEFHHIISRSPTVPQTQRVAVLCEESEVCQEQQMAKGIEPSGESVASTQGLSLSHGGRALRPVLSYLSG